MTIICFNDYRAKSKARKRARHLCKFILNELKRDGNVPQEGQAENIEKKLTDLFYQREKTQIGNMISETDIYRAAKLIIDQYGGGALIEAGLRQDELLQIGDYQGAKTWSRIGHAIEWMQSSPNLIEETCH